MRNSLEKLLFLLLIFCLYSCRQDTEKRSTDRLEIPLFDFESIEPNVIYVSHGWLNKRSPTLIKMYPKNYKKHDNVILTENDRVRVSDIEVSESKSFEFHMSFSSFPTMEISNLEITKSNRSTIDPDAFFFIVPGHDAPIFLEHSNVNTKSGKKVLQWLKENVSQMDIYEAINIWRVDHGREPSEDDIKLLRKKSYILDEQIHLNRVF